MLERCFRHVEEGENVGSESARAGLEVISSMFSFGCRSAALLIKMSSSKFADALYDSLFTKSLVADISCDGQAATAMTGNQPFSFFGVLMLIEINHRHARPFLSESNGDRGPIPLSPPVITATLSSSFREGYSLTSCTRGRGRIWDSRPG
jgi:hypothetical protein